MFVFSWLFLGVIHTERRRPELGLKRKRERERTLREPKKRGERQSAVGIGRLPYHLAFIIIIIEMYIFVLF